ncbi:hypothetical protein JCM16303_001467 [Sporobolomyces ruberrimus]
MATVNPQMLLVHNSEERNQEEDDEEGSSESSGEGGENVPGIYDVDKILNYACFPSDDGSRYEVKYLVRWLGYDDPAEDTWGSRDTFSSDEVWWRLCQDCERTKPADQSHDAVFQQVDDANRLLLAPPSTSKTKTKKKRSTRPNPRASTSTSRPSGRRFQGLPGTLSTSPPRGAASKGGLRKRDSAGRHQKTEGQRKGRSGRRKSVPRIAPSTSEFEPEETDPVLSTVENEPVAPPHPSNQYAVNESIASPKGFADDETSSAESLASIPVRAQAEVLAQQHALMNPKIGRASQGEEQRHPSGSQPSPSLAAESTADQLSSSTIDQPPSSTMHPPSSSLSGSDRTRKAEEATQVPSISNQSVKDGFIKIYPQVLLMQKLPEKICGRNTPKWPLHMVDPERIGRWWKIGGNPIDNFENFDRVLANREVYVTPPPTANERGISKVARAHSADYDALQLVLAHIDGVRQADSLRRSVSAIFVHATLASELGRSQGRLSQLDHFRHRDDVVYFVYGTGEDGQRALRQFWKPITAVTFTPTALLSSPTRLCQLVGVASTTRSEYSGGQTIFPFMTPQYLLCGGILSSPVDGEGNEMTLTDAEKALQLATQEALFPLLWGNPLLMPRLSQFTEESRLDSTIFPSEKDETPADPDVYTRLSERYPSKLCYVSPERLQKIVLAWRWQYSGIRRWIIIATPEEKAALVPAPGITIVTLEEAEAVLAQPLPEIIG